jgi:VWFA-related protein
MNVKLEVPMRCQRFRLAGVLFIIVHLTLPGISQVSQTEPQSSQGTKDHSSEPPVTFRTTTRMVTLEVVAKDGQGHHATGLKASDFQVFEQSPARGKEKHEQKIAAFREVRVAELATEAASQTQVPAGVYSNAVVSPNNPVPPTILMVDGLNTELKYQAQVHVQMMRMLKSLPSDVPVAVFLFGHRLRMLQDFTTDSSLLQRALASAVSTAGVGTVRVDPRDDPDAVWAMFAQINQGGGGAAASGGSGPAAAAAAQGTPTVPQYIIDDMRRFEQEVYASNMDLRVQETIEALVSLARHVGAYPGRKNLLWISTSFPIYLDPLLDDSGQPITNDTGVEDAGLRNYWPQLQVLSRVLSEAKVAVYPINPAGVQASDFFDAETRVRYRSDKNTGDTLRRETLMHENEQDTMQAVAEGTGGQVCAGSNDLGDCVRKAMDDSSIFYEIAYYPDSQNWNGEYRRITVKTTQPGLRLAYRQGYFANPEGGDQKAQSQQAACEDYLNATSIPFTAKNLLPDSPEGLKFHLTIDVSALTFLPVSNGGSDLNLAVAVCTFDKKGRPFLFMTDPVRREFNPKEHQWLTAHGLPHIVSVPGPKPTALRLLVMDIPTGRMGSVNVKVEDSAAAVPAPAAVNGAQQPAAAH